MLHETLYPVTVYEWGAMRAFPDVLKTGWGTIHLFRTDVL